MLEAVSPPIADPESDAERTATLESDPPGRTSDSNEFYRELVRSMRNGVLAIHRDGTVAIINHYAYRTLGLDPQTSYLGRHYAEVLGSDHKFSQVLASAFELDYLPNRSEVRLAKTGKTLGFTLSRIVDDHDTPTGAVLYFKDLTRVEQLEERERLRDRLAALGEMAAAIAHEVKNPLAGIQVMAGLLKRQSSVSDDDQGILNDIISEAQVANKIVVDLLEFVRPINLQIERVSISDVLRETVLKYEEAVPHSHVYVDLQTHVPLPAVPGDYTQLRQLFTNLLINAFEALDGDGHVSINARFVPVDDDQTVAGEPSETYGSIVVEVTDDGPGIPQDVTERIFSPFFTTKPRGSGLGLAIVRKIIDAHDGRIDVRPAELGGTRFQVTLPVTREASDPELINSETSSPTTDRDEFLSGGTTSR